MLEYWNGQPTGEAFSLKSEKQNQISETELKRHLINSIDFYYLKSNKNILISFRESLWFDISTWEIRVTDNLHG